MRNLIYRIVDSASKIEKSEWDLIFGDIPQGYEFFKAIDESNLPGFSFHYILIYEDKDILLIAPLFIADFNLDIAVKGISKIIIRGIREIFPRFLVLKTLFCGSPISENGVLGIRTDLKNKDVLMGELTEIMKDICNKNDISFIVFKDFLKKDLQPLEYLKHSGFFVAESFPTVIVELGFNSLDDYFKSLGHNTRKELRHKVKKAKSTSDIEVKVADSIENIIDEVYELYLNTYNAGNVKFEKLTKDFFINAARYIRPQTKFFLYYLKGKIVAFNLCFAYPDLLIDEFIGFDYDISYKYNLYFFSWCYNIDWCLKNSIRYYQVGQTDYHPKIRLGGRLIPLYAYVRYRNPVLNLILRLFAKFLQPTNFDEDIKSNAWK